MYFTRILTDQVFTLSGATELLGSAGLDVGEWGTIVFTVKHRAVPVRQP